MKPDRQKPQLRGSEFRHYVSWALDYSALVASVYAERSGQPEALPRSSHDLHIIISDLNMDHTGHAIEVSMLEHHPDYEILVFLGFTMRVETGAPQVFLRDTPDAFERRFGYVQESFQALFDDAQLRAGESLAQPIASYMQTLRDRAFGKATPTSWGEFIAEIAAMDVLFPYWDRVRFRMRHPSRSPAALEELSATHGVPQRWLKAYSSIRLLAFLGLFKLSRHIRR